MNAPHARARAELLSRVRAFFAARGFLEVETPLAAREVIPERHIDLFRAAPAGADDRPLYLHASPEMAMKLLLCGGAGPIFQLAKSFRAGESASGGLHNPEFTLLEWYRPGDDLRAGMDLLDELAQETLAPAPCERTSYRDAFARHAGADPFTAPLDQLRAAAQATGAELGDADRDELLNVLLASRVEPRLGAGAPEIVFHYPASQAALAATATDDRGAAVAERFELYWRGVELANGYHELTDAAELRRRLEEANRLRVADGRRALPLPETLLAAMDAPGLPPCAGVALGFDRLVMLAVGAASLDEVMVR